MRISVKDVYAALRDILEQVFGHVEASRTAAHNRKPVLFVRLYYELVFNLLFEFRVVVLRKYKRGLLGLFLRRILDVALTRNCITRLSRKTHKLVGCECGFVAGSFKH